MDTGTYIPLEWTRADHGKATYPFDVGDKCSILGGVLVRDGEDLESEQLKKLPHGSCVDILQIGSGPTGKRVHIRDESGQDGWVSVVAENGEEKLQVAQKRNQRPAQGVLCQDAHVDGGHIDAQEQQQQQQQQQQQRTSRNDQGKPTQTFQVGDEYEVVNGSQMRQAEDLNSPPVRALPNKCRVKVVDIGSGPTGRRICVSDERGREGWISVAAANGEALLRPVPKRKPEVLNKTSLAVAAPAKGTTKTLAVSGAGAAEVRSTEVVIQWQDRGSAIDILNERLCMEGVARPNAGCLSVLDACGALLEAPDGKGVWAGRDAFPLTLRCRPQHPGALQVVLEALRPPAAAPSGAERVLMERLREAAAQGSVDGARRAAQQHVRALAAEAGRGAARPAGPPAPAKTPPGWRCPLGFQPLEHSGALYLMRSADGLIFEPGRTEVPVGVWSSQRQRVEPAMGRTEDNPHTQINYLGKTYVLLHGSKLFDPETQHVVAFLNRETLEIERVGPIPIAVSSFLEQRGFSLQSLTSMEESAPFVQVLRRAPLEALADREEALEVVSQGSWRALRYASSELRGDRELVLQAVRGEHGAQSWKMLLYAAQQFQRDPEVVLEAVRKDLEALQLADPALLENRDFMLDVVQERGLALRFASEELRADPELARAAVAQSWQALRHVAEELRDDAALAEEALRQSWRALELAGEELRADRRLVARAVEQSWRALQFAAPGLRRDAALLAAALEQSPDALQFAAPELLADRDFMLAAVRRHGLALGYAAEGLRADRGLVSEAVRRSARALRFAAGELRADREVVLEAVRRDPEALKYAAGQLSADREVLLACARQSPEALEHLPEALRGDRGFMAEVVRLRGTALKLAAAELRADPELVLQAVGQTWRALKYAADELCADRGFMLRAVALDGTSLAFAAERLRADPELVLEAARQDCELLEYAAPPLCADRAFMLRAVRLAAPALRFAAPALRADRELVLEAVAGAGLALEHASEELRGDRAVALAAVRQDPAALGCAAEALRGEGALVREAVRRDGLALRLAGAGPRADAGVVLEALRQNWRALRHAAAELRADRGFMREAVRVNGLALSLALGEAREDPELLLESTKDPMSKLGPSAFSWPAGMALAKLPRAALARSDDTAAPGRNARASGLPLTAFASVAPDAAGLGPQALLSVALREMGAWGDHSSNCPAGVLDAALDILQPHIDPPQHGGDRRGKQLTNVQHEGSAEAAASGSGHGLGSAVGSEPALSVASAASECSTTCTKDEGTSEAVQSAKAGTPACPRARRAPNARVVF